MLAERQTHTHTHTYTDRHGHHDTLFPYRGQNNQWPGFMLHSIHNRIPIERKPILSCLFPDASSPSLITAQYRYRPSETKDETGDVLW